MIKTIFFDLGNVLVFFSHEKMFHQLSFCTGLSPESIRQNLTEGKLQENYETGRIDSASLCQFFQKKSPKTFTLCEFLKAASDIFAPNDSLWPLVEELKNLGIRLVLLSNTSECHFNHVKATYPILHLFDDWVLSFEVGVLKPDPRIFLKALSKAGCNPNECFYTDDILEFVESARQVGLDAELFSGTDELLTALSARGLKVSGQPK